MEPTRGSPEEGNGLAGPQPGSMWMVELKMFRPEKIGCVFEASPENPFEGAALGTWRPFEPNSQVTGLANQCCTLENLESFSDRFAPIQCCYCPRCKKTNNELGLPASEKTANFPNMFVVNDPNKWQSSMASGLAFRFETSLGVDCFNWRSRPSNKRQVHGKGVQSLGQQSNGQPQAVHSAGTTAGSPPPPPRACLNPS